MYKTFILIFSFLCIAQISEAQTENKLKFAALYDGIIVGGYVDEGAYLNFTGPNLSLTKGVSKFTLGMMPSLRFKTDHSTIKNTFVTPSLGAGFTYCYKWAAIQVPCYYTPKTATKNGVWNIGIGLGIRINGFKKKAQ
jgi:hypothetical protein